MSYREIIWQAINAVRSNLLRAILTVLIIAFGIMALVGILTSIDALIYSFNDNFSSLGANSFIIYPEGNRARGHRRGKMKKRAEPIVFKQAMEFKDRFDFPGKVGIYTRATSLAEAKYGKEKTNPNVRLYGIDENYLDIKGLEIEEGRALSLTEIENGSNKCIIGMDIVKKLFNDNATRSLGKVISVGNIKYKVIGILKSKGSSLNDSEDRMVMAPLLNIKRYYGSAKKNYTISVATTNADNVDAAESVSIGIMRNVRGLKLSEENDFEIRKSDGLITFLKENTVKIRWSAVIIGIITLLGAAIGLMNIMLVSVTERTREIGITKAIGATRRNILIQFLTEAVLICQMGGLIGIFFGILAGYGLAYALGGNFIMPWNWILVGITTCMVVGLCSGMYPALKASRLDPIEALRYE